MICFPNIKINLGLHVINKRADGFHTIETVFFPVKYADILEVIASTNLNTVEKIRFSSSGIPISGIDSDNLIVKAYHLLDKDFNLPPVIAHLHKIIPMGAGLGGGSSDAAHMIVQLNSLFKLGLTTSAMEAYAAELGSDCAFFITNQPAYALGKGHELEPVPVNLSGYYFVLLYTGIHSNTALAYKDVQYTHNNGRPFLKEIITNPVESWKTNMENDFERSVFDAYPLLKDLKEHLYDSGAVYAAMSGSGSSLFAIFKNEPLLNEELQKFVCFKQSL